MSSPHSVLVSGGGGFIGGYLVSALLADGAEVRAVDVKPVEEWHQHFDGVENLQLDLRLLEDCRRAAEGMDHVYNLACRHGRHGLHRGQQGELHALRADQHAPAEAARELGVERYFFASSACVYAADKQATAATSPLSRKPTPTRPARGRLRLGEAVQRAMCRHFTRGLRARDPGRPLPQRLRPARAPMRAAARRPGGDLPQGGRGEAVRQSRDRDLGRRQADAQLHLHRRLPPRARSDLDGV